MASAPSACDSDSDPETSDEDEVVDDEAVEFNIEAARTTADVLSDESCMATSTFSCLAQRVDLRRLAASVLVRLPLQYGACGKLYVGVLYVVGLKIKHPQGRRRLEIP